MNPDQASTTFEEHRPLLRAIAYRMLGGASEAEDVVQEAWLRYSEQGEQPRSPRAYLSTIVTRLCLDHLKSARVQRETYVGPWLPEPVAQPDGFDAESISLAFLVLLESLTPVERAVFLLHQVFDYGHAEIGEIIGRDEAAVRQLFHRAREHVATRKPRFAPSRADHERLLTSFLMACTAGDLDAIKTMLADDAVAWSDGGGKARAALNPVHGADGIARMFIGLSRKLDPEVVPSLIEINGQPALALKRDGKTTLVLAIETDGQKIYALHTVLNPDKLGHV